MSYILALDQGTTSSRAMLFDQAGSVVAQVSQEFAQIFPQPGWVEHDAGEIWSTQLEVAKKCLKMMPNTAAAQLKRALSATDSIASIAAIGITNQRETTVLWDRKTGQPLYNAIVWQDRRTAGRCDELARAGYLEMIQQKTGLVLDAYFQTSQLSMVPKASSPFSAFSRAPGMLSSSHCSLVAEK